MRRLYEEELMVASRRDVADDVIELTLRRLDGGVMPEWTAGAHIDVALPDGTKRQYSLCGPYFEGDSYRIAVLHEPQGRGGSAFLHGSVDVGATLRVSGPRNHFQLGETNSYRFIAGGIGITPILAMVRSVAGRGDADWRLLYGGRSISSMAYLDELAEFEGHVQAVPQDSDGMLDLEKEFSDVAEDCLVYVCGPAGLLNAVEDHTQHLSSGRVRFERFTLEEVDRPAQALTVHLAQSKKSLEVPATCSILSVLLDAGYDIPTSCGEGTCGTCETSVLAGEIDHRDAVLTDAERSAGDTMMVCVSRAAGSELTLDL